MLVQPVPKVNKDQLDLLDLKVQVEFLMVLEVLDRKDLKVKEVPKD